MKGLREAPGKVKIGLIVCSFMIVLTVLSIFWFSLRVENEIKQLQTQLNLSQNEIKQLQTQLNLSQNEIKQLQTQLNLSQNEIKQLQTRMESRHPAQGHDYIIFEEEGVVKAKNGTTGTIEFSSSDVSTVVNQALEQGGGVFIKSGKYRLDSDIVLSNRSYVILEGDWPEIYLNEHEILIKGHNYTYSMYNRISGLEIINGTLRIENSFKTTVKDMVFKNSTTAMEIANTDTWSECTKIENCHFINCLEGIVFRTPVYSATKSYANTEINRCYFTLYRENSVAINVEQGADFTDSLLHNVRIWIGNVSQNKQIGISLEGSMLQTLLQNVVFESFAKNPTNIYGIQLGRDVEPPILGEGVTFLGWWTAEVYNPFGKWIFGIGGAFKRDHVRVPLGLNDEYGRTIKIDAYILEITSFKARMQIEGTCNYNETVTVRFRLEYVDGTQSNSVEKIFNKDGKSWLEDEDLLKLTPHHNTIGSILVDAKTDSSMTDTTVQIDVYGTTA